MSYQLRWATVFGPVLGAGLILTACAGPAEPRLGFAYGAEGSRPCYRTLGRVDCHASPLEREVYRRVGAFDWAAISPSPD